MAVVETSQEYVQVTTELLAEAHIGKLFNIARQAQLHLLSSPSCLVSTTLPSHTSACRSLLPPSAKGGRAPQPCSLAALAPAWLAADKHPFTGTLVPMLGVCRDCM